MNLEGLEGGGASPCLGVARQLVSRLGRPASVIEIGTAYGENLSILDGIGISRMCCVDPMYDWVPDVRPDDPFDESLVDARKVTAWHRNVEALVDLRPTLMIGRSWDVALDPERRELLGGSDLLIVDGCHHPAEAVQQDYWSFEPLMADEHLVVFDDLTHGDPQAAFEAVRERLSERCVGHVTVGPVGVLHVRRGIVGHME